MFEFVEIKTVYLIFHLLGVALGAGGAFVSDALYMRSLKDKKISKDEMALISLGGNLVWFGLLLLTISGLLLMSLNWNAYIVSSKFIVKMIVVLLIALNGVIIHHVYLPKMRKVVGKDLSRNKEFKDMSLFLYVSGALSLVSWITATVLGAFKGIPFSVTTILSVYGLIVCFAMGVSLVARKKFLKK